MKRPFIIVAALACIATLISSCGTLSSKAADTERKTRTRITIRNVSDYKEGAQFGAAGAFEVVIWNNLERAGPQGPA